MTSLETCFFRFLLVKHVGFKASFELFFQGFLEFLEVLWELLGIFLEALGGSLGGLRESIFEQPSRVFGLCFTILRAGASVLSVLLFLLVFPDPFFIVITFLRAGASVFSVFSFLRAGTLLLSLFLANKINLSRFEQNPRVFSLLPCIGKPFSRFGS